MTVRTSRRLARPLRASGISRNGARGLLAFLFVAVLASGCGQKGPLMLPGEAQPPATPAPLPAPVPGTDEDEPEE